MVMGGEPPIILRNSEKKTHETHLGLIANNNTSQEHALKVIVNPNKKTKGFSCRLC